MAHGQAREARTVVLPGAVDRKRWLAVIVAAAFRDLHQRRRFRDVFQQRLQIARCLAVVERRDDLDRLRDAIEIAPELLFGAGVEHGGLSS
jgi:hypothetical protein